MVTNEKESCTNGTICPYAGVCLINEEFNECGLSELIDKELGIRGVYCGYSYSDILRNLNNVFHAGGDCAEDIGHHLKDHLHGIPDNKVPSPDVLLRGMKELSVDNIQVVSRSDKTYQFNTNPALNLLNIKMLIKTGQLTPGQKYDFDYDNQIIEHEKYDAKRTYKKNTGYFPGVATLAGKVVYLENRDGNANVKTGQSDILKRCYQMLESQDISVNRSRMDAGSYSQDIIEVVASHSEQFYIRSNRCEALYDKILNIDRWEQAEINNIICEVASIRFTQFFEKCNYRLVVSREKRDSLQLDLFEGAFTYRCILTNDWDSSEQEVIRYYNQRGSCEKIFDIQNNDFGWKHLPFSDLKDNTVYLIVTAMLRNFYNYLVAKVAAVFDDIEPVTRMKRFIFRFISVAGKWVYRGKRWILNLYTEKPYEKVFARC